MAHTPSSSPKPDPPIELYRIKWIWISAGLSIVAILLCLLIASCAASCGSSSSTEPANPTAPVEKKPAELQKKIVTVVKEYDLDPVKWSEWISIVRLKPPEVPGNSEFEFQINAPEWYEYHFVDDTKVKITKNDSEPGFLELTKNTFQLRGEGRAILRIQYFFR